MKKLSLCMLAAAFLFTSCNFFVTPEDSKKDKEDVKPELPAPTDFEYTAENDVPAAQSPFDEKLCNKTADSLELSDGDWTIVEINQSFNTYSKIIAKVGVTDSNLTYKSGIVKLDVESESIDEEDDTPVYYDESNLKTSFDTIKDFYLGPISEYSTFSNGYLIGDDKTVYIASIKLDSLKSYFESIIKDKDIKSNTVKNKYFIEAEGPHIFPSFIYIYKDANLNDAELNSETPEVTQPEITNPENSEEPQNPPTESEEPSENQNKPETDLKKIYTKDNDVPADKAPFYKSSCQVTGKAPVFSNGDWKIIDIAEGYNFNAKAITDVAYADGKYDCSSIVVKYDFPRNGASEETVNYEGLYSSITQNGYADFLSHGYLTEEKIVLITKDKSAEFENIYLAQLNAVSKHPEYIYSNKEGTKYIIPYKGNGYLQTIYIYKEPLEDDSEAEDDLGYTAPTLPESVGEDPFKGKCFINTLHGEKYDFGTDGTYIRYIAARNSDTYTPLTKSKYSYNADSNLIYSSITEANFTGSGLLSFSEFLSVTADDDDIEMAKKKFGKSIIIKAELTSDNQLSVIEPYYIEVPELTEVTQMRANYNNTTIELLLSYSKELTIRTQRNKTKDNGTSAVFNVKTVYDIIDITENTIIAKEKSKGEYEATDGYHPEEDYIAIALENPATIRVAYKNAKVENGLFSVTISGEDSSSKLAMKADSDTSSNPTYELKSTNDHTILYSLVE